LQEYFIFFGPDGAAEDDFIGLVRGGEALEASVAVVEYYFDVGGYGCGAGSFVEECLAVFL